MKLAVVASGDFFSDYGGGQVYVRNIVDELANHPEITTAVISFNRCKQPSVRDYKGITVYQINDDVTLKDTLQQLKPAVVHANGEKLVTSRVCEQLNLPCVVTAHHGGIVCPAGTLLNTDDEICRIPADYLHCLKCYLRHTPTGLLWYPILKKCSQKRNINIGEKLKRLPFIPFLTPIGETGLIVTQKLKDWNELSEKATCFIAPSEAIAEALTRNGCITGKITVIPHGIPIKEFRSQEYAVQNTQSIRFYYVGRINYVKGIHIMLKAFTSIDNPNIELHLIGGAGNRSEQQYQKRLKQKYRKDRRIIWHGKLPYERMIEEIKGYHCLIHPAIYLEVFGLNISEALAQQKYVIASRCGGPEMQIHSERDGLLIEPNNVQQLVSAIKNYISNPRQSESKVRDLSDHVSDLIYTYQTLLR